MPITHSTNNSTSIDVVPEITDNHSTGIWEFIKNYSTEFIGGTIGGISLIIITVVGVVCYCNKKSHGGFDTLPHEIPLT